MVAYKLELHIVLGAFMDKKDYFVIRNSDGADKWDKPIVVATNIEEYYIALPDKRLFDIPRVVLVEEEEAYVLIKNNWKYDDNDLKKCRNVKGHLFVVEDIEYIKVGARDYAKIRMVTEDDIPSNIIIRNI